MARKRNASDGLPDDVDRTRWMPDEDRKGRPVRPGDRVSVPIYPRGTAQGVLVASERAWSVLPDGSKVLSLLVQTDDGSRFDATSKILKLKASAGRPMARSRNSSNIDPAFASPLERDARITIYIGGMRDGDPVWFPLSQGAVPIDIVRRFVGSMYPDDLEHVASTPSKATFSVKDRDDSIPVDVELQLRSPRKKRSSSGIRKRKNYELGVSPWILPTALVGSLVITAGIFAFKAWREKKQSTQGAQS